MAKGYHHLKLEDRCQIYALKKQGVQQKELAKAVGKSESCVSKELRRNKNQQGYQYNLAHKKSVKRRTKASKISNTRFLKIWEALIFYS